MNLKISTETGRTGDGFKMIFYTAQLDNIPVCWAQVIVFNDNEVYLERIDVEDDYQRRGIGTAMIEHLVNEHHSIYAAPDNPDSKRLFKRLGQDVTHTDWGNFDQGFGVYRIR